MPKLFVIPASQAPIAVILRRGPSQWCHVIEWQSRTDTFTHGAWIKGRIYEEKCDVSPDGKWLISFIHQGNRWDTEFTHAWTALSRVPWLKAHKLWPNGTTYGGGGRFIDNQSFAFRSLKEDLPCGGKESEIQQEAGSPSRHAPSNEIPDTDWCGKDIDGRIIFTRGGQLFRRMEGIDMLVADFTDLKPDPQPAPEWAWPVEEPARQTVNDDYL